ncbi:hypothetical protein AB0H63_24965 [Micromonospora echinospora]|uniref:hypothetical protein n=1 Tax=Micromonospora echinospora TaxID=1877 RepID=UPI0033D2B3DD
MPRHHSVPLAPRHRRDWRTAWRRCGCGCAWPCPDRYLPVPVEPADAPVPPAYPQVSNVPVASAAWAVSGVADELREAYVAVGAAVVLLERVRVSAANPALRAAQRGADHALDLADEAERLLGLGVARLRTACGRGVPGLDVAVTVEAVVVRLRAAADRIDRFPHRIRVAGEQLRAAGEDGPTVEAATGEWVRAAGQLELTAAALRETVAALAAQFPANSADPAGRGRRP